MRSLIAILLGLAGFIAYVGLVVRLGDVVITAPWPLQAAYFLVAGIAWVVPARWLIIWAVKT